MENLILEHVSFRYEGADAAAVMKNVAAACKKVEEDCEIYL